MHTPLHIEFARAQQAELLERAAAHASAPARVRPDSQPPRATRRPLLFWRARPAQQPTR